MEVTKKDVEKLIELRKENTFLNHLWNVLSRDFRPKGEIGRKEIKVWRQNMWNATFYPIFTFEFNANNHLINISDKLNPVGKTFIGIFSLGFLYLIFPESFSDFDFIGNWPFITFIAVSITLVVLVALMIYKFEKKNQLEQILELLDVEVKEKKPEKEWSVKNILIRLFLYPFSIFVISICVWSLFEHGIKSIFMTLFGIGICGLYLYSDVKMILKSKKTTGNNGYGSSPP
ncbi:Heme exporter protein D [Muriicola jejuensis]|uniref:Uncharacterized protein n=1 Tax=Muriicola jejuensis TaxID=504488 RepID=A0A6P0UL22_9FLAO|nr:hypothetical protein [Muriicola jejuensis]NER11753.1 hypothetical protein [Muriicola jejuensis]SMP26861.1 Heme exporter protein D [Muriicola jejuensis]